MTTEITTTETEERAIEAEEQRVLEAVRKAAIHYWQGQPVEITRAWRDLGDDEDDNRWTVFAAWRWTDGRPGAPGDMIYTITFSPGFIDISAPEF